MKTPYPLPSYFSTHLIPLIVVDAKTLAIKEVNKAALKAFGYSNTFLKAHSLDLLLINNKELKRVQLPLSKTKKLANCIAQVKSKMLVHYDVFLHPLHQKTKRYLLLEWHQKSSPLVDNKAHPISPTDHFFKEAIHNSSIVSITDSKGTITFANEKFVAISGYSIDELIGKNHRIINSGYHPRKFWVDMWKTISKGKTWRAEVKNRAKDGSYYWVDTFIMPFVNESGKITDFLSVRNDITQRKLGEEESQLITARLNEAMHFGRMGIAELSLETNQLELSTELLHLLGEDDSSPLNIPLTDFLNKYVYPEDVSLIKSKIQEGLSAVTEAQQIVHVEFRVRTAQGNLLYIDAQGTFRKNGKALGILRDITKKRLAQQEALDKSHQIEMMLSGITDGFFALDHDLNFILVNSVFSELANMPIQEMIGKNLLELFPFMEGTTLLNAYRETLRTKQSNQLDEINGLNEKQAFRIFIYPNPLGLFINFHDISSAKIAESKLRDTTELFNRLSENVPGVIYNFYLTPEGKEVFPFVSSGCEKFFEISAETLMRDGNALFEIIHPEDIKGLRTSIQKAFHTHEPWTYECRIITKSGVTKWIAGHSNPYIERNGDNYWYGYLQDITQQKLDQISIAESEIKNRLIIENSGEGILFTQPDGKILSANPEACRIFGMREDEIIALGRAGLVAEDPKSLSEILAKRKEQGAFQGEILMKRKGGGHFIAEISSKLFVDANGELKGSIILRDITDRKKVEQVKAEMLQRFDSIIKHLPGFIYQYRLRPDGTSHFPYSSSAVRHFYSTDSETLAKDAAKVFDVIYPDDLKYVENTIQRSANDLSVWQAEYRVTLSNGQLIWVEGKATPEKEADGSILWHGYISDITKRKEIEIKLQDSRNRLRTFFDSTEDSIVLLDHACNLLDYNTVAAQNAKNLFDQDMYPGQNISAYFVPGSKEVFFRDFTKALSGESVNTEFKLNLTEKDYSWWQFKYFPMWAEDGHVAGVSFVSINITEKKKLAEEVEKLALIASRTSNAVIFTDAKGHITWVNKGFEQISEYTLDEVLGKKPGDFLQGPDTAQETIAKMHAGLRNEKGFKVELLNYSKSGKKYWLDIEVQPLRSDDGVLIGFMAIESEITSLKKAVEEMQKSEQALQTFMDYAPMVAFIKDLQGRYTFYNKMYRDFMKGKDLHAGYTDYDIFDKEFSDWCRGRDKHIVDTGETLQFEHFVQGQTFLEFKFPLKDALNNTFAVGGISLNITEKLEAQKKIAENEERLRSITNNLSDGVLYQYVVNAEGGIESFPYASSGVQELFEITADMLAKDPMLVFNMVHPEDLEAMLQKGEHSRNTLSTFEHE